jgi:four helix bundle protein
VVLQDFRQLKVWERAHALALRVYRATQSFPKSELYALTSQARRSATSIPTNIAEGCGRKGDAEFARFLQIAMGSACELEYLLILANDLGYLDLSETTKLSEDVVEVKQMLSGLLQKLKADS